MASGWGPRHPGRARLGGRHRARRGSTSRPLFRTARLQSLQAYDAWAFWVPKGKAIFFFQGLDEHVFTTTPNAPYPPRSQSSTRRVPRDGRRGRGHPARAVLVLLAGVVGAVAGLAAWSRTRRGSSWPPLLLVLVVPRFQASGSSSRTRTSSSTSSWWSQALLLALWLRDSGRWRLAVAAVLLAGAVNTKREGIVFAASVLVAAFAVARPRRWPRLAVAAVAVALAILPWRIWIERHDIPPGAPSSFAADRMVDAVHLSFEVPHDRALVGGAQSGPRSRSPPPQCGRPAPAAYVGVLALLLFAGGVWSTVGFAELTVTVDESGNPIVRYTGSIVLRGRHRTPAPVLGLARGRGALPRPVSGSRRQRSS